MTPTCTTCGSTFELDPAAAAKYPGWLPRECPACYRAGRGGSGGGGAGGRGGRPRRGSAREQNLTTAEVLATHHGGPDDGVFTDGSATPNPGPGGWGAVYVLDGAVVDQRHGHEPATTNNRMELVALAAGVEMVPPGTPTTIYTDSRLVVDTLTKWAYGWERKGWTRKGGAIKNLDLVQPLFEQVRNRPEVTVEWIAAHSGNRWNEYADALATAWMRDVV